MWLLAVTHLCAGFVGFLGAQLLFTNRNSSKVSENWLSEQVYNREGDKP